MSTVKAINLQHPTSSNTNITLDVSGSVTVTSNLPGTTGSSNTSPEVLTANGVLVVRDTIRLKNPNAPGSNTWTQISNYNDGNFVISRFNPNGSYLGNMFVGYATGDLSFCNPNTGGAERLRIDAAGRVTKPNQPCWSGQAGTFSGTVTGGTNHVSGTGYSGSGIPNGTLINVGSIWNTTTGRVTIPLTGYYLISVIGHKDTNTAARDALATISVNGGYFEVSEIYGNYGDGGGSLIMYLSANDWIEAGRNNGFAN
jgi:hypothetical protein